MVSIATCTLELVGIILVFDNLHRQKFRLSVYRILYILSCVGLFVFADVHHLPDAVDSLAHIVTVCFLMAEYSDPLKKALVGLLFSAVVNGTVQMFWGIAEKIILRLLASEKYASLSDMHLFFADATILALIDSLLTLLLVLVLYFKVDFHVFFDFMENKLMQKLFVNIGVAFFVMIMIYKFRNYLSFTESALLIFIAITTYLFISIWKNERLINLEKDKRIRLQDAYNAAYEQLLVDVRNRQHEFHNHIAAINGMNYTYTNYEELLAKQREYCERVLEDNKYNNLLYACKNSVIDGFLYSKFQEAERLGIQTEYDVLLERIDEETFEVFDLVEILGILYDNAVEAVLKEADKRICLKVCMDGEEMAINVRNSSRVIPNKELSEFFQEGYSSKGEGRGLGLAKLVKLAEKYDGKVIVDNEMQDEGNWIMFEVRLKEKGKRF